MIARPPNASSMPPIPRRQRSLTCALPGMRWGSPNRSVVHAAVRGGRGARGTLVNFCCTLLPYSGALALHTVRIPRRLQHPRIFFPPNAEGGVPGAAGGPPHEQASQACLYALFADRLYQLLAPAEIE